MTLRTQILHDPYLVGNGEWCPSCCPDGAPAKVFVTRKPKFRRGCNRCQGHGRIAWSAEEIVARTVAEARAHRRRNP
ncbi:hypothetical protein [Methylobacterium terrae]|uniref:hypothetical protein n=1 Tax=Methylobacterium terrae TaxID=2202827 RepID=UPI0013A57597|nr:hypothetical protein [Methylobacterium terrae]